MQPNALPTPPHTRLPAALRAAFIALIAALVIAIAAYAALGAWTARYVDRLAPTGEDEAVKGVYLTRLALNQPDRLVLMGSSELTFQDDYHAVRLFAQKPTGFNTYVVGAGYRQSIHNLLALSALGADLRGKKIALFISPTWFTEQISDKAYRKNFSLLQAYEFAYTSPLSPALKQRAARRLLRLGSPGTDDPLLRNTLSALATGNQLKYWAGWPLGRLELLHLRFKDRWDLARLIITKKLSPEATRKGPTTIDWAQLQAKAAAEAAAQTTNNRLMVQNDFYTKYVEPKLGELQGSARAESWVKSSEYDDLQLVLDALHDLGADPLFISLPVLGPYADFRGHAAADRQQYYAKVKAEVRNARFPVVDLGGYEYEPGFHRDPWHQGWKGSVAIAQLLDEFDHGHIPEAAR